MAKSISLTTFTPTEEELSAARSLLKHADAKSKKAKGNSMGVFLKANVAGDGNVDILALPKSERSAYLEKYMAYQSAKKS